MGLLTRILSLPISAPAGGALWIAGKIHEAAEAEWTDPAAIRRALTALEQELEAGRISEEAFEDAELMLLQRLKAAKS
ncbi:MAG: gas vesicle protein GvpG [Pseudomonadota bacterium]